MPLLAMGYKRVAAARVATHRAMLVLAGLAGVVEATGHRPHQQVELLARGIQAVGAIPVGMRRILVAAVAAHQGSERTHPVMLAGTAAMEPQ
jgi:hypothetical protein